MYQLCLFLTKGSLYCLFTYFETSLLIYFLKLTIIKAIKEEIQNNTSILAELLVNNKYSLISFQLIFRKILEKYLQKNSFFKLEISNFIKTQPFCRYSCIISIIQECQQKVDFSYFSSKFQQQFQSSKNFKFSGAFPR